MVAYVDIHLLMLGAPVCGFSIVYLRWPWVAVVPALVLQLRILDGWLGERVWDVRVGRRYIVVNEAVALAMCLAAALIRFVFDGVLQRWTIL